MYESDRRVADLVPTTLPLLDKMKVLVEKRTIEARWRTAFR